MNVLEVYPYFLPERGGVERHIYDLCLCLKGRGHRPFVFAWMTSGPSIETIDGILIERTHLPRPFRRSRYATIFFLCLQIMRLVYRYEINLIHAHDYLPGLASVLACIFLHKPVFVTFHLPIWRTSYSNTDRLSLDRFLKKCFIYWISAIICVSKFTYQETLRLGFPDYKMKMIYNWITPLPKYGADDLKDAIKKFNLQGRRFILSVGRLVDAQKGFSMLVGALRTLINRGYNIDLVIIGDGPDKEMLIRNSIKLGLNDRFHLLSQVSDRDLACLYQGCEVFVLSSRYEGLPLVLLEAMSFGKLVVATKVGGVPEIIVNGHNGLLVEPNQHSIALGIETILANPCLKTRFAKELKETLKIFSMNNCYKTIALFEAKLKEG